MKTLLENLTIRSFGVLKPILAPISASGLSPIRLHHLVDFSPITISEATNMALVVEIFRKLGCRQAFDRDTNSI